MVMTGETDVFGENLAECPCFYKCHVHWPAVEPRPVTNGVHGTTNLYRRQFKSYAYIPNFIIVLNVVLILFLRKRVVTT